jgi:hypothetical protein
MLFASGLFCHFRIFSIVNWFTKSSALESLFSVEWHYKALQEPFFNFSKCLLTSTHALLPVKSPHSFQYKKKVALKTPSTLWKWNEWRFWFWSKLLVNVERFAFLSYFSLVVWVETIKSFALESLLLKKGKLNYFEIEVLNFLHLNQVE